MIKYVLTRVLNMHPTSQGLIGEYARVYTVYVVLGLCVYNIICIYMYVCVHCVLV